MLLAQANAPRSLKVAAAAIRRLQKMCPNAQIRIYATNTHRGFVIQAVSK